MEFRHVTIKNNIRVRGDASEWTSKAMFRNGQKAYEIQDNETVFGAGFLSVILSKTQTVGGGEPKIIDRIYDERSIPAVQVSGHQNTMPEDPFEYIGVQYDAVVMRVDGADHIKPALAILKRKSDSALILTASDERAKAWVSELKQAGQRVDNVASKPGEPCISVATVSGFLAELAGESHALDSPKLNPGMLIIDQCDRIPFADLQTAARSVRPAFRMGFMQEAPSDVSEMQALCHEMGPWQYGRPKGSPEFRWDSPL